MDDIHLMSGEAHDTNLYYSFVAWYGATYFTNIPLKPVLEVFSYLEVYFLWHFPNAVTFCSDVLHVQTNVVFVQTKAVTFVFLCWVGLQ